MALPYSEIPYESFQHRGKKTTNELVHEVMQEQAALSMKTILLAEDDDALRTLITRALEKDGHDVIALEDGFELADFLEAQREDTWGLSNADLLITDVRMPGRSGLDVLREARARGLECPAIVLTAFPDDETREAVIRLGEVTLLEKPVDFEVLRVAVRIIG